DGASYFAKDVSVGPNSTTLQLARTYCEAVGGPGAPGDAKGCVDDKGTAALGDDVNIAPQSIHLTGGGSGRSHSIVVNGSQPSGDASAMGPRAITAGHGSFSGGAVTATNSDDLAGIGVAAGFSGSASVNLSGVVSVVNAHTSAHVDSNAIVMSSGDVRVAAGNQFHELAIAASLAISGTAGVGVAVGVGVIKLSTDAYLAQGADVESGGDVSVKAVAREAIIGV